MLLSSLAAVTGVEMRPTALVKVLGPRPASIIAVAGSGEGQAAGVGQVLVHTGRRASGIAPGLERAPGHVGEISRRYSTG
jgi:hypothetical protein